MSIAAASAGVSPADRRATVFRAGARAALILILAFVLYQSELLGMLQERIGIDPELAGSIVGASIAMMLLIVFRDQLAPSAALGPRRQTDDSHRTFRTAVLVGTPAVVIGSYYSWYVEAVEPLGPFLAADAGVWGAAGALALHLLVTPIVEEILFRRLLLDELAIIFRSGVTVVVVNSVWFGTMHSPQVALAAMAASVPLAIMKLGGAPLRLCVYSHALGNAVAIIASLQ